MQKHAVPCCSIHLGMQGASRLTAWLQANLEIMMLDKRTFFTDEEQALQVRQPQ